MARRKKGESDADLRELVKELQHRVEVLEGRRAAGADPGETRLRRSTRRDMLKLAGATLMGAAGSAALGAIPASAVNGTPLVVGTIATQDQSNETGIVLTGSAHPFSVLKVDAGPASINQVIEARNQTGHTGVLGYSGSTLGQGVIGYTYVASSLSIGVFGGGEATPSSVASGVGVFGTSDRGVGIVATTRGTGQQALYAYTSATNSAGIYSYSKGSHAIKARSAGSFTILAYGASVYGGALAGFSSSAIASAVLGVSLGGGPDAELAGSGRLVQFANLSGGIGAPSFNPKAGAFEMVRAKDGAMFVSRSTGTLQNAWKRINALRVDAADGSGAAFKPLRLVDTRLGFGGPAGNGTIRDYVVAGAGTGTQHIPSAALAITGNLTVVAGASGGFMSIHPAGSGYNPATDPATFNFGPHTIVSNAYFSGLGTGGLLGEIEVYIGVSGSSPANFIIDITGYVE